MAAYRYLYDGTEDIAVSEFLNPIITRITGRIFSRSITVADFLAYEGDTGLSNNTRLYLNYTEEQQMQFADDFANRRLSIITPGTELILPLNDLEIELLQLYGANQFQTQRPFNAYYSENFMRLIDDPTNVRSNLLQITQQPKTTVDIYVENVRVFIWIRSQNQLYDISRMVRSVTTGKSMDVGSFNIELDPFVSIEQLTQYGADVLSEFPINQTTELTMDFMERYAQMNDLIFIRYERLMNETQATQFENLNFEVGPQSLPGQIWDMIGLIDVVKVAYNAATTSKVINFTGRDLMKLIIDDASYFIPISFVSGSPERFIFGGNPTDSFFRRNIINGQYENFFINQLKAIPDIIGFIINHLSNIRIIDNELFDSFDNVSTIFQIGGVEEDQIQVKQVEGIWKIIKVFVDRNLQDRRIADDSFANPDGTLLDYFRRVCQEPFVEFWGDTNGDQFDFTVRQPPFTKQAITDVLDRNLYVTIENKDLYSTALTFDERYYSWYQIQAQNQLFGTDQYISLSFFPIIYLPQYVEVFGNKRLIVPDNYLFMSALKGDEEAVNLNKNSFVRAILNDYQYLIETNMYLPFTRKGSIVMNGDRRIKVGSFVRLEGTNELFYVTAVNNSITLSKGGVDRLTEITVERGMVIPYIRGQVPEDGNLISRFTPDERGNLRLRQLRVSYFNIVDTQLIRDTIIRNVEGIDPRTNQDRVVIRPQTNERSNFTVVEPIFNFFLNRRQMSE